MKTASLETMAAACRGELRAQFPFQLVLDLVDDGDGVGVGDLDDAEADRGLRH